MLTPGSHPRDPKLADAGCGLGLGSRAHSPGIVGKKFTSTQNRRTRPYSEIGALQMPSVEDHTESVLHQRT